VSSHLENVALLLQPALTEMIFFFGFFPPIMITLALKFDTSRREKAC